MRLSFGPFGHAHQRSGQLPDSMRYTFISIPIITRLRYRWARVTAALPKSRTSFTRKLPGYHQMKDVERFLSRSRLFVPFLLNHF